MTVPLEPFSRSESAVSESVGYLLITGVMVTAIGLVLMIGYPMLQGMINQDHMQNMDNGFILLGQSIDHVAEQKAPTQSLELYLNGGSLSTYKTGVIYFNITYLNGTVQAPDRWDITTITYQMDSNTQIGYEFGGSFKNIGNDGYVLKSPNMINSSNFIIPLVNTYSSGSAMSGNGLAKVEIYGAETSLIHYDNVKSINISVTSDYFKGWEIYLKGLGMTTHRNDVTKTVYGDIDINKLGVPSMSVNEVNKPIYIDII